MGNMTPTARRHLWLLVLAFLVGGAGIASAQDAPEAVRRLEDRRFFLDRLTRDYPDSGFWRAWEGLYADARAVEPGVPGLAELTGTILLEWGRSLEKHGDEDAALEKYTLVLDGPKSSAQAPAAAAAAGIEERKADALGEAAENRAEAIAWLEKAAANYAAAGASEKARSMKAKVVRLKSLEGLAAYAAHRYGDALDLLSSVESEEGSLPPGEAADALADLRANTGRLELKPLAVPIDGTPVAGNARIVLTPKSAGERYEGKVGEPLRWRSGTYSFELFVPGNESAVVTKEIAIAADRTAEVEVPEKFPEGMVFVPASPENGVARPFFMDRTEVTEAEYRAVDPSYELTDPSGNLPAHDVTFTAAKKYATAVGKALPTEEQWLWAAFGGTDRELPWGAGETAERMNMGTKRPTPVGSYPGGRSPFGLLDMAGNVWEWLESGYAIGGGFRSSLEDYRKHGLDPLRQPKPGEEVYDPMTPDEKERFNRPNLAYRVIYGRNSGEVGLRCVLPL